MPLTHSWVSSPDELDRVADTRLRCYSATQKDTADFRKGIRDDVRAKPGDFLLVTDGAEDVGTATAHSFTTYIRGKAMRYLEEGKVVVFAAGTGNPFFTTDTAAALRGREIEADIVLKATKVDGVYTADPKLDKTATRYQSLTFDEAIIKNLKVMDATALALCRDQKLPINVFSIFKEGALKRVVMGEDEGTLVHA